MKYKCFEKERDLPKICMVESECSQVGFRQMDRGGRTGVRNKKEEEKKGLECHLTGTP